jgi:hypothetical protein
MTPRVIRHPARVDLFDDGKEWGPLASAKCFDSESLARAETEPGDVVMPRPDTQPIQPFSPTP